MPCSEATLSIVANKKTSALAITPPLYKLLRAAFFVSALFCLQAAQGVFAQTNKPGLPENQRIAFDEHFINGNKHLIIKQPDEAVREFKLALAIDPDNAAAHYSIARAYQAKGLLADAENHSLKATLLDKENTWYLVQLSEIYKEQREYEKAGETLEKVYLRQPKDLRTLFDATYMFVLSKKLDRAIKLLETAEKSVGVNEDIIRQKQSIYAALGKGDKAVKEGEKLLRTQPSNTRYMGMLADVYLANGKEEKANELYRKVLSIDPDNGYALLALADDYRNKGNNTEYVSYMGRAMKSPTLDVKVKLKVLVEFITKNQKTEDQKAAGFTLARAITGANPDEAGPWMLLGDLYAQNGKFMEAHEQYEKAVLIDPSNYTVWRQMVICSNEMRDFEQMKRDCERAIELFPEEALFYSYLTFATQQLKQYEKTIEVARKGLEVSLDQNELRLQFFMMIGDAANALKQYSASDSAFEAALLIDPQNAYALNNYAYFLSLRKQNLEKAAEMSLLSIKIDGKNASYYDTYGWILFVQKKYSDAKKQIETSLQIEPDNPEVLDHYGDVLFLSGETDKAVEQWKRAKSLQVENPLIDRKIKERKWYDQ
jgi:tetratricopeptide (TPR) repeat protein